MLRRFLLLAFPLALIACAPGPDPGQIEEEEEDYVEEQDQGKADSIQQPYFYFSLAWGKVRVRERSTAPLPGAPQPLTYFVCGQRFTWDGVERVECPRAAASLEVLYRTASRTAVTIFRPSGRSSDQRSFATCTTSSTRTPFPTYLRCTWVKPTQSGGGLSSPIPSSIPDVPVPNAHWVDSGKKLMRAMAPRNPAEYDAMQAAGIEAVLIFKKPTGNGSDVAGELGELRGRGLAESALLNIPFPWKDFPDFASPCRQTLQALRFLETQRKAGRKSLLHCTVGEDRTGYLAGIYRLLAAPTSDLQSIFHGELCERGYSSGNPLKPVAVTSAVDAGLTPLFRKLAYKIRSGELTEALEEEVCSSDPGGDPGFEGDPELDPATFACGTSTRFQL